MKKYCFLLILILQLYHLGTNGQSGLKEFTLSIIDTTQAEIDQANSIYNWIAYNISYDVKSYLKLTPKNQTPEKTLKVKKGLCHEYADLMTTLCNSVGIEAYTIYGYSKGFDNYPGKVFLHSNHCWNVIRADTVWIIVDPTWGSGYLDSRTSNIARFVNSVRLNPVMKQKQIFVREFNPFFFNISTSSLLRTHYPLDPKWLLQSNPPTYKAFESNYIDSMLIAVNWQNELEKVSNKSQENMLINEGKTAFYYNPNNLSDLAYALYQSSFNFDLQRQISTENLDQFKATDEKLAETISLLTKQQHITDSVYNSRLAQLKKFHSNHSRSNKTVEKEAKNAKESFKVNKKGNAKKTHSIYKKIDAYEAKIATLQETHLKENKASKQLSSDQQKDSEIRITLVDNEMEQQVYRPRLDSLIAVMDELLTIDAILNDSILVLFQELEEEINKLNYVIMSGDEILINIQSDSVWNIFTTGFYLLERKKKNSGSIIHITQLFKENKTKWEELLKTQQILLKEFYKTYNLPDAIYDIYEQSLADNILIYQSQIAFENKLLTHNGLQQGFTLSNYKQFKKLNKSIRNEFKQFDAWYKKRIQWEKQNYGKDKERISNTIKEAGTKRRIIGKKILTFNQ